MLMEQSDVNIIFFRNILWKIMFIVCLYIPYSVMAGSDTYHVPLDISK